jgi:hypothetical protein
VITVSSFVNVPLIPVIPVALDESAAQSDSLLELNCLQAKARYKSLSIKRSTFFKKVYDIFDEGLQFFDERQTTPDQRQKKE